MEALWKELLTSRLAVQYTTHLTLSDDQGQGLSARQEPFAKRRRAETNINAW
jgi:hypothetical protein